MWTLLTAVSLAAAPTIEAQPAACGAWTATVAAEGRGRVTLSVDGDVTAEWDLRGDGQWPVQGQGTPGTRVRLEAALKRSAAKVEVDLPPPAAQLAVTPSARTVGEGAEPRFDLQATTPCALETLTWAATVRQTGARREGAFLPGGQAWFVLPAEQPGAYDVEVVLLGAGGQTVAKAEALVQVVAK
jgi:hypothetical protein